VVGAAGGERWKKGGEMIADSTVPKSRKGVPMSHAGDVCFRPETGAWRMP
jgi:hypothetical protein